MNTIFLHGLDSSGFGTKGKYFASHFPNMLRPDFNGTLEERLNRLRAIVEGMTDIIVVGSSFGGLMGACLAIEQPNNIRRLIMLAPALNFSGYRPPDKKIATEAILMIGKFDTVTPPDLVIPAAEATFLNLEITISEDDHLLHQSYQKLDWRSLLA